MSTHLIIPDPHSHPDHSNVRFKWLGRLIAEIKPDVVICIGDWVDMPSLCSFDRGTTGYEGRRYAFDIAAGVEAQNIMFSTIRKRKKKMPRFIMHEGNHEHRIARAIDHNAVELQGTISMKDLQYERFGWEVVPYTGATPGINVVDGVAYAHYHTSGIMGRPVSGVSPAYQLLVKQYMSSTQGHTHTTDYCVRTNAEGRQIQGLVVGVFQDWEADYAGVANDMWWKGIVIKRNVRDGEYDPQWISMKALKEMYT